MPHATGLLMPAAVRKSRISRVYSFSTSSLFHDAPAWFVSHARRTQLPNSQRSMTRYVFNWNGTTGRIGGGLQAGPFHLPAFTQVHSSLSRRGGRAHPTVGSAGEWGGAVLVGCGDRGGG